MAICDFCRRQFKSYDDVRRHQHQAPDCKKELGKKYGNMLERIRRERREAQDRRAASRSQSPAEDSSNGAAAEGGDFSADTADDVPNGGDPPNTDDSAAIPPDKNTALSQGREYWDKPVPGFPGATYGTAKTTFEQIRDDEILTDAQVFGPFKDEDEWELAKWLIKHVGHTAADEFLKLRIDESYPTFGRELGSILP
ncbi:hypothetical protein C8J57DRAFT_1566908 [Mycena rebaudengoi]|nr:hypothetical protein C8J57DRAFT_1566908 [Mycena rebaudengoi]